MVKNVSRVGVAICISLPALASANPGEIREQAQRFFQPIPEVEVLVEQKELSKDQIELGKWLFFEPRLSRSHIISCNTCHSVGTGGADNIPAAIERQLPCPVVLPQITMLPDKLHHNVVNLLVGQLNLLKKNPDSILYIY